MIRIVLLTSLIWASSLYAGEVDMTDIYTIGITRIDGESTTMAAYRDSCCKQSRPVPVREEIRVIRELMDCPVVQCLPEEL